MNIFKMAYELLDEYDEMIYKLKKTTDRKQKIHSIYNTLIKSIEFKYKLIDNKEQVLEKQINSIIEMLNNMVEYDKVEMCDDELKEYKENVDKIKRKIKKSTLSDFLVRNWNTKSILLLFVSYRVLGLIRTKDRGLELYEDKNFLTNLVKYDKNNVDEIIHYWKKWD